jgi:hypothetical protein
MKKYNTPEISIVTIKNDDCVMLSSLGAITATDIDKVKYSDIK